MKVRYNSLIGKIDKLFGHTAITFGDTAYTWAPSLPDYILKHEYCHTLQYKKYGVVGFLLRYVWYSIKYGYSKNPLEVEAYQYQVNGPPLKPGDIES